MPNFFSQEQIKQIEQILSPEHIIEYHEEPIDQGHPISRALSLKSWAKDVKRKYVLLNTTLITAVEQACPILALVIRKPDQQFLIVFFDPHGLLVSTKAYEDPAFDISPFWISNTWHLWDKVGPGYSKSCLLKARNEILHRWIIFFETLSNENYFQLLKGPMSGKFKVFSMIKWFDPTIQSPYQDAIKLLKETAHDGIEPHSKLKHEIIKKLGKKSNDKSLIPAAVEPRVSAAATNTSSSASASDQSTEPNSSVPAAVEPRVFAAATNTASSASASDQSTEPNSSVSAAVGFSKKTVPAASLKTFPTQNQQQFKPQDSGDVDAKKTKIFSMPRIPTISTDKSKTWESTTHISPKNSDPLSRKALLDAPPQDNTRDKHKPKETLEHVHTKKLNRGQTKLETRDPLALDHERKRQTQVSSSSIATQTSLLVSVREVGVQTDHNVLYTSTETQTTPPAENLPAENSLINGPFKEIFLKLGLSGKNNILSASQQINKPLMLSLTDQELESLFQAGHIHASINTTGLSHTELETHANKINAGWLRRAITQGGLKIILVDSDDLRPLSVLSRLDTNMLSALELKKLAKKSLIFTNKDCRPDNLLSPDITAAEIVALRLKQQRFFCKYAVTMLSQKANTSSSSLVSQPERNTAHPSLAASNHSSADRPPSRLTP